MNNPEGNFYNPDEDVSSFYERKLKGRVQVVSNKLDIPLSVEEILKATKQLSSDKAAGPTDCLTNSSQVVKTF